MTDYISREAALKDFEDSNAHNQHWTPTRVKTLLLRQPADGVAPVVRCKGCRFGSYDSEVNGAMVCEHWKDGCWRQEDDFCSHGMAR